MRQALCRALLLLVIHACSAKRWRTSLVEGYQVEFKFLAKFAFAHSDRTSPGTIHLNAWTFMPGQRVLLFRNDKWFNAYDPASRGMGTDCPTRASHADVSLHVEKGNFYGQAGQVIQSNVVQQEPEYWFLALVRCQSWIQGAYQNDTCVGQRSDGRTIPNGVFLYYEMTMKNPGGYWSAHYSADEQGLFELHVILLAHYVLLALLYVIGACWYWEDHAWFAKLQAMAAVLCCSLIQHGMLVHHYIEYAASGVGVEWAYKTAEAAESLGTVLFTLLLLVLSKGWMVTRARELPSALAPLMSCQPDHRSLPFLRP